MPEPGKPWIHDEDRMEAWAHSLFQLATKRKFKAGTPPNKASRDNLSSFSMNEIYVIYRVSASTEQDDIIPPRIGNRRATRPKDSLVSRIQNAKMKARTVEWDTMSTAMACQAS
jgi:hypothetical protein